MKTTYTTLTHADRIEAILEADNEVTTEQAREYLTNRIECIGEGETFADKLEHFGAIGNHRADAFVVNVMEPADGDPFLVYGHIEYETDDTSIWCDDITTLLEIMESGDEVPECWVDNWTVVDCQDGPWLIKKRT